MGTTVGTKASRRDTKRISAVSLPKLLKTPGYHHDGGGLYLQVTATGGRSWVFRYMLNKRSREMGLGSADHWDLTSIRQRADEIRRLLDQDIDPIDQRNAERREVEKKLATERTFSQCAELFHEKNSADWKNAKHAAQFLSTLKTYAYPVFGSWPVSEVTSEVVVKAVLPIWASKHETATRVLQRIRKVLIWSAAARHRDPLPSDFWDYIQTQLPAVKAEAKHHEACPYPEAGALLIRVRDSGASEVVKLAFLFTVLTAARSGETRGATWDEIRLDTKVWIIPAERMKAGRVHRVPLSTSAVEVLKRVRQLSSDKSLVFPSPRGVTLSDMAFTQLLRRLEAGCTMHGFRSTFRDWAAEQTNYPAQVCETALAHVNEDAVEAAYLRSDQFEKRRGLMADWAKFLESSVQHTKRRAPHQKRKAD